ncbi:MAG: tetratricopeptide repeat protein, partial [Chloroflexota bacterium]
MNLSNPSPNLNILLLVSNPLNATINIGRDVAKLEETLQSLPCAATVTVQIAEADQISSLLSRGNRPNFQILHYLGHGYQPDEDGAGTFSGAFAFEGQNGLARRIEAMQLQAILNPTGLAKDDLEFKLAILSACHSASLLPAMSMLGIEHVIAIDATESVLESAAVTFYRRFYETLLTGGTIQGGYVAGRNAVLTSEELSFLSPTDQSAEARKFLLLPEASNHDLSLAAAPHANAAEQAVQVDGLPAPAQIQLNHERPVFFVGRQGDMRSLIERLQREQAAMVVGVSGVGKTALAKETAHWLVARGQVHADRAFFIPLGHALSSAQVRQAIALALNLVDDPSLIEPAGAASDDELPANDLLARRLPPKTLLILDEAENAIAQGTKAVRDLLEILVQSPARPLLIVTSQNDVGSRRLPAMRLSRLTHRAALELFRYHADVSWQQVHAWGEEKLIEVLNFVDRLPRAVVLVASEWRFRHEASLDSLLADLQTLADQIMADPYYPDEVKSVTVGIQLAYERLQQRSPQAAELFAQLSLFPSGLKDDGIPAIFGSPARRLLYQIEEQSLVERPFSDLVELPAPFRAFALRLLPDRDEMQAQIGPQALAFYYTIEEDGSGWVEVLANALIRGGDQMGGLIARYEAELESIEFWLDWGYEHEEGINNVSISARLTGLLRNLYVVRSLLSRQSERLAQALKAARGCSDRLGEANVLKAQGDVYQFLKQTDEALRVYEEALTLFRAVGARLGEANVLKAQGDVYQFLDQRDEALRVYEEA